MRTHQFLNTHAEDNNKPMGLTPHSKLDPTLTIDLPN